MARFRGTIQGQRGEASRLGGTKSGLTVRANGWHVGVKVESDTTEEDAFIVSVTSGSNASENDQIVGRVVRTKRGIVFVPWSKILRRGSKAATYAAQVSR